MKWPTLEQISAMTSLPEGFRVEFLKRSDVPALIEAVGRWHPDIAIGGGSCYLRDGFYAEQVQFDGGPDRNVFVALFRRGSEMAGMWSWEKEPDSLALYGRLIVLAPAHRGAKLLAPAEQVHWPDPKNMTPRSRALYELLFSDSPAGQLVR